MTVRVDNYFTVVDEASASKPQLSKLQVRDTSPLENCIASVAHASMPKVNMEHAQIKTSQPVLLDTVKAPTTSFAAVDRTASTPLDSEEKTADVAEAALVKETSHEEFEREMTDMLDAYDAELKKPNVNPATLYKMALYMLAYLTRHSSRMDHQHVLDMVKKTEENVKNVKESYHNTAGLVFGIMSAVVSVASAFCAFSPFFGARLFLSTEITGKLANSSQALNALTSAFGFGQKVAEDNRNGERTVLHHAVEQSKEHTQARRNAKDHSEGQKQGAMSALHELLRAESHAFKAASGDMSG